MGIDEIQSGVNALGGEFVAGSAADTPDFGNRLAGKGSLSDILIPVCPDNNAIEMMAMAFGQMVTKLS